MTEDELIPAKPLLRGLAARVSRQTEAQVVLTPQTDASYAWQGLLIHPLQPLENAHQRASREAVWAQDDPEKHRDATSAALGDYFQFGCSSPRRIPRSDDAGFDEKLRDARSRISKVWKEVQSVRKKESEPDNAKLPALCEALRAAIDLLGEIVEEFEQIRLTFDVDPHDIPILPAVTKELRGGRAQVKEDWTSLQRCLSRHVRPALRKVDSMLTGLACIQVFHVIDTFYLYRLLVKYRIESDEEIGEGKKRHVSGDLTDILNNEQGWVRDWLKEKMVDLNRALATIGDVGFHLKGGRALYYVLRQPEQGKNDWDTSVLIDPALGARAWYAKLRQIHDLVLERLQQYKREFFVLMHKRENQKCMRRSQAKSRNDDLLELEDEPSAQRAMVSSAERVEDHVEAEGGYDLADVECHPGGSILFPAHRAGTKAEMIDIGIPRRDTPQSIGHWREIIEPGVILEQWTDNIPVPAHRYYIDEYLMMVRSAFDAPQKKVEKRVARLAAMLKIGHRDDDPVVNMDEAVRHAYERIHGGMLDPSLAAIERLPLAEKRLLTVSLEEFSEAYGLWWKTGLAGAFDRRFRESLHDDQFVEYSPSIDECREVLDSEEDRRIVQRIGFVHKLAHEFEAHLAHRASYLGFGSNDVSDEARAVELVPDARASATGVVDHLQPDIPDTPAARRKTLGMLVKALYSSSVFSPDEELQIQFAVTGSFAAYLHADYGANLHDERGVRRVPDALRMQLKNDLDPVDVIEVKVYCDPRMELEEEARARGESIAGNVFEMILGPAIRTFGDWPNPAFDVHDLANGDVVVRWPAEMTVDDLTYKPVVMRIRVVADGWPQLSFIWGYPVLALPDLIREYDRRAAETAEYTAEQRLLRTSGLLRALLTYFEVDDASAPDGQMAPGDQGQTGGPPPVPPAHHPVLFYLMLGVDVGASKKDMHKAYTRKARLQHPDKNGDVDYMRALQLLSERIKGDPRDDNDVACYLLGFNAGAAPTARALDEALQRKLRSQERIDDPDAPGALERAYRDLGGQRLDGRGDPAVV